MAGRPKTRFARQNGITCRAKTRKGTPCQAKWLLNGGRCRMHGGNAGVKTAEGKARIAAAVKVRWTKERERIIADIKAGLAAKKARDGYIRPPKPQPPEIPLRASAIREIESLRPKRQEEELVITVIDYADS